MEQFAFNDFWEHLEESNVAGIMLSTQGFYGQGGESTDQVRALLNEFLEAEELPVETPVIILKNTGGIRKQFAAIFDEMLIDDEFEAYAANLKYILRMLGTASEE